jgi:hypothetical protein
MPLVPETLHLDHGGVLVATVSWRHGLLALAKESPGKKESATSLSSYLLASYVCLLASNGSQDTDSSSTRRSSFTKVTPLSSSHFLLLLPLSRRVEQICQQQLR